VQIFTYKQIQHSEEEKKGPSDNPNITQYYTIN